MLSRVEMEEIQYNLKKKIVIPHVDNKEYKLIGGCDISFHPTRENVAVSCLVVLKVPNSTDLSSETVVYSECKEVLLTMNYIPGFLAFREAEFIKDQLDNLRKTQPNLFPDVLFVDGNGTLHPRKFGVACHIGVLCDIACIGVAKNYLELKEEGLDKYTIKTECKKLEPDETFMINDSSKNVYGAAYRPKLENCKNSIFVSPGNKISLGKSIELTKLMTKRYRVPEPIRQADLRSRKYIREELGI
jgi:deoxyinosine 3'endonuclease (endonuclease V)